MEVRLPFVRKAGDETPSAWWEWLLLPVYLPIMLVVLFAAAALSIPIGAMQAWKSNRREKAYREQLRQSGRYLDWRDVESRIDDGKGTLVIERFLPKGPFRQWWTEEDLIGKAPVSLPHLGEEGAPEEEKGKLRDYAALCKSLCGESGSAKLTELPSRTFFEEEALGEQHSRARILLLNAWGLEASHLWLEVLWPPRNPKAHSYGLMRSGENWTLEWDGAFFKLKDAAGQTKIEVDASLGHRELDPFALFLGSGIQFYSMWGTFYGKEVDNAVRDLRGYVSARLKQDHEELARLRRRALKGVFVAGGLFVAAITVMMPLGLSLIGKKGPITKFANENPGLSITALILSFSMAVTTPIVFREYFQRLRFLSRFDR